MLKSKILKILKIFFTSNSFFDLYINFYVNSEELSGKFIQGGLIFERLILTTKFILTTKYLLMKTEIFIWHH